MVSSKVNSVQTTIDEEKRVTEKKMDSALRNSILGASIFISLPLSLRIINSRVFFRKTLDDYYM